MAYTGIHRRLLSRAGAHAIASVAVAIALGVPCLFATSLSQAAPRTVSDAVPASMSGAPVVSGAFERGISFTGYSATSYQGAVARQSMRNLRATGANWAMVLVTVYQKKIGSTAINRTSPQTPTDASLRNIIAYARSLGLKVMLKPQVDLLDDPGYARSQIGTNLSGADWSKWFASYQRQIVHYARLAAAAHCEQFSVGCELDASVAHVSAWRRIIARVRNLSPGELTYAANVCTCHTNPHNVTFWGSLDLIGFTCTRPSALIQSRR